MEDQEEYRSALEEIEKSGTKCENFGCTIVLQDPIQKENDYIIFSENPEQEYIENCNNTVKEVYSIAIDIANYTQTFIKK